MAVLLGGQELQIHRIERDETVIGQLIELEAQFWAHVEEDEAPPADESESADRALRALYPQDSGRMLDFTEDMEMSALFSDLVAFHKQLEDQSDQEARLRQRMGNATRALFEIEDVN